MLDISSRENNIYSDKVCHVFQQESSMNIALIQLVVKLGSQPALAKCFKTIVNIM